MTKSLSIISFLIILLANHSYGQTGTLAGVVKDAQTKEALIGVSVFNQNNQGEITDSAGKYRFKLSPGEHLITFSSVGYETKTVTIDVKINEEKTLDILLTSTTNELDAVVITAGKFEQKESEITMSIAVLRPAIIENKATTSMDDLLQNAPGVAIVDNEPQIRGGSGFSFGAGSRVTIMVDDMSILSGDAGRPSWGFLPVENVEQVEIIKGASSVLYGSSALNGVINIRTGFAKSEPQTKVTLLHGFYSKPQTKPSIYWKNTMMKTGINFFHSRKINALDIVLGISILGDDGYLGPLLTEADTLQVVGSSTPIIIAADTASSKYSPFNANRYDSEYRYRANLNLRYRPKAIPGLIIGLATNWLKGESMASLLWDNSINGIYQPLSGGVTRTKQLTGNIDPSITYLSRKGTKHILRGRWYKLDNNNDNNQTNLSTVTYGEYQLQQNFDSLRIKDLILTAGITSSHTYSQSDLFKGIDTTGINKFTNNAVYVQLDKKIRKKLNLSLGMRYEQFILNETTEGKPVFRSGLNYQLAKATYFRGSYGQGYRFPSIAEKYIRTSLGQLSIFPNGSLQSETSTSMELGFRQGVKKGKFAGMLDIAIFRQYYTNFVEFTFGQWETPSLSNNFGFGFRSVNTGKARVDGIESNISGVVKHRLFDIGFQLGYTYTNPISLSPEYVYTSDFSETTYLNTSSDTTNNILKYRIQHMARVEFTLGYKNLHFGTSFRLNSQMKNVDNIYYLLDDPTTPPNIPFGYKRWTDAHTQPDYIIDSRISYTYKKKHKFSLIINNVMNREYSLRPMKVEAPRTTVIQYVFNL